MIPLYDPALPSLTPDPSPSLHPSLSQSSSTMISREAIDDRLRALNDVQNALWKSAEELLKLKSLLPASPPSYGHLSASSPIDTGTKATTTNKSERESESESYPSEDD